MKKLSQRQKIIYVYAQWKGMSTPHHVGNLSVSVTRGKEVFSFEYAPEWLSIKRHISLDPFLLNFPGPQYTRRNQVNFGVFLDTCPDRWGRTLMDRREIQMSRLEGRERRALYESDYLLDVYDEHRMGGLRFRLSEDGPFLDDNHEYASPPWTALRNLESISKKLEFAGNENDPEYDAWLNMLIGPGSSLGGARPKAGVIDESGHPWIAKFPSAHDRFNVAKWEFLAHILAERAGIQTPPAVLRNYSGEYDTFLTKRFDRTSEGERIHFSSAMTMTGRRDGESGASYLDLAEFLVRNGVRVDDDLQQLWRRILLSMLISNTDDHLRNHGFLLSDEGWVLSPAYDINPLPYGNGLALNISRDDNRRDLELMLQVVPFFRLEETKAREVIHEVVSVVRSWRDVAEELKISFSEMALMEPAFALADEKARIVHDLL